MKNKLLVMFILPKHISCNEDLISSQMFKL